jgi:hypothetical protein
MLSILDACMLADQQYFHSSCFSRVRWQVIRADVVSNSTTSGKIAVGCTCSILLSVCAVFVFETVLLLLGASRAHVLFLSGTLWLCSAIL